MSFRSSTPKYKASGDTNRSFVPVRPHVKGIQFGVQRGSNILVRAGSSIPETPPAMKGGDAEDTSAKVVETWFTDVQDLEKRITEADRYKCKLLEEKLSILKEDGEAMTAVMKKWATNRPIKQPSLNAGQGLMDYFVRILYKYYDIDTKACSNFGEAMNSMLINMKEKAPKIPYEKWHNLATIALEICLARLEIHLMLLHDQQCPVKKQENNKPEERSDL